MELNTYTQLRLTVRSIVSSLERPSTRYKGLVLSTKDQQQLAQLVDILQQELERYDFWLESTVHNPSLASLSRSIFNDLVFEQPRPGLILVSPEDWMFDWTLLDKRSFWSALSETYGRNPVVAVVAEGPEFNKIVKDYFLQKNVESSPFHVWFSKYQQRD